MMEQDIQEILFSQAALERRVKELAGELRRDLRPQSPPWWWGSSGEASSLWPTWCAT